MTDSFTPTAEQQAAIDLFRTGVPMAIQAGAGTGKTATLRLLADGDSRTGQYLAFNKAIVEEAKTKFPTRVACNTAHSVAFRAIGRRYSHRLKSQRIRSEDVARRLGIDPIVVTTDAGTKRLAPGFLAGYVMRAVGVFCQSADDAPGSQHFPYLDGIDLPTPDGRRTYDNQHVVRDALLRPLAAAWADLSNLDGTLRFSHDCYLKIWQLSHPTISADYILLDEAQDTNPVLLDVFWRQADHAQLVAVGDDNQQIYEWRGAVNALGALGDRGAETTFLSQSFRFGQAIADEANRILSTLASPLRLTGTPAISSTVEKLTNPDCVLTRTNAAAMRVVLEEIAAQRRPHLVGGGSELTSFARATIDLQAGRRTSHPELACFDNWSEVRDYVANDQQGDELRLMVDLMDEYGALAILGALDRMSAEADADLVVSTAHKSKGREWQRVQLGSDFPNGERDVSDSEWRLLYVAVTRAQQTLDISLVPVLAPSDAAKPARLPSFYVGDDDTTTTAVAAARSTMLEEPAAPVESLSHKPCPYCGRTDVRNDEGMLVFSSTHLCSPVAS